MRYVIATISGMIVAMLVFSALPSILLMLEYNSAVALAYFFLSLSVLSIGWSLTSVREKMTSADSRCSGDTLRQIEVRLEAIELHLSEISSSAISIEQDFKDFNTSRLPDYPSGG